MLEAQCISELPVQVVAMKYHNGPPPKLPSSPQKCNKLLLAPGTFPVSFSRRYCPPFPPSHPGPAAHPFAWQSHLTGCTRHHREKWHQAVQGFWQVAITHDHSFMGVFFIKKKLWVGIDPLSQAQLHKKPHTTSRQ